MSKLTIYSWNVNGLRAIAKKNFLFWLALNGPDILCVQETKADEDQIPFDLRFINSYSAYFSSHNGKKGYSGVATYTQPNPVNVKFEIGNNDCDGEGRIIATEYKQFVLFNVYFPNGKASPERLDYKIRFYEAFLRHINMLRNNGKSIIFCGDVNTAHKPIDLARPKDNEDVSGFLPLERAWLDKVIDNGYIDTYRLINGNKVEYSWWSQRGGARMRNVGWRIDYFFVSPDLKDKVVNAQIHCDTTGSDHCPISLTLSL